METSVDWGKIKEGFRGFETLALEFVKDQYKNDTWEKTKDTRDGNKDGIAVVMGYQKSQNQPAYWWMEAKYSDKKERISRYRLDATIVSAILEGNVTRVIFVTNMLVDTKTIIDIRTTLKNAIGCENVAFCSKHTLEYWLCQNRNIYINNFDVDAKNTVLKMTQWFITQEIDYYLKATEYISYKEPLRHLSIGETYVAFFSVFSPTESELQLKIADNITGVSILSDTKLYVKKGDNELRFCFKINDNYGDKKCNDKLPVLRFKVGGKDLLSYCPMVPGPASGVALSIDSQKNLLNSVEQIYDNFYRTGKPTFVTMEGESGVGKTHILNDLIVTKFLDNNIFFGNFEESPEINNKLLVKALLFLIVPYVDSDSIDIDYIKGISNIDIKNFFTEIYAVYNDFEKLTSFFANVTEDQMLLPLKTAINQRILIFDNIQNAKNVVADMLVKTLISINRSNLPVFVVLSGQEAFFRNTSYWLLAERCNLNTFQLEIGLEDILHCFKNIKINNFNISRSVVESVNFSVIELMVFAKYLLEDNNVIKDANDFLLSLRSFQRSEILGNEIFDKFKNLFKEHPECRELCDKIYWSYNSISYQKDYEEKNGLMYIINSELAKFNDDDSIEPYHDIYKKYYRIHYTPRSLDILGYPRESAEYLQNSMENPDFQSVLRESTKTVFELFEKKQYHTILYVLDNAFKGSSKNKLRQRLTQPEYYKLYLIYGLAAHQQSTRAICKEIFQKIYEETKSSFDSEMLEISKSAAWELCVIAYESLEYENVKEISQDIINLIYKLQNGARKKIDKKASISFHDIMVIDMLIKTDFSAFSLFPTYIKRYMSMRNHDFVYRSESFKARYALTLCTKNIAMCIKLLDNGRKTIARDYGKEDKHYLWCEFYYHFYILISKNKDSHLEKMLNIHEQMRKNQNGNYRKKLFAIAAYFYSRNDLENGDKYLFKDAFFYQDLRNRYKAFYFETMALHEIIIENSENALNYLEKAQEIFKALPSYEKMPIHNETVIRSGKFNCKNIKFWFGEPMKPQIYYIDSRSAW